MEADRSDILKRPRSQTDDHYRSLERSGTSHVFPAHVQGVDQARGVHQARQVGECE
jgi:hypothetical protein